MIFAHLAALAFAAPSWTLAAGGDIMFYAMDPKKDAIGGIATAFSKADVAYANLEIPLTASKTPTTRKSKEEIDAKTQFVLKADPAHIKQVQKLGLDLVGLGNNHVMDYGPAGMRDTRAALKKAGMATTGAGDNVAEATLVAVKELSNGLKVGLVSYLAYVGTNALTKCTPATTKGAGVAGLDLGARVNDRAKKRLAAIVAQARKKCDVVLVALHWGVEKQSKPIPYQIDLGRAFIDAGADAVLGSHPHVLQGREVYKGKPIIYSLGNLISPMPAKSAVYTLKFEGRTFKAWSLRPMTNSGGKAAWMAKDKEAARIKEIEALDKLIGK
jgi:poly-gamma-glutamate synthesis protein (capsule biosynthesis protein)